MGKGVFRLFRARRDIVALFFAVLAGAGTVWSQNIPAPKLGLIRQAVTAMKLDARIGGLVAQRVDAKVEELRLRNPDMNDSLAAEARAVIARVYEENLEGPRGLMPRVYAVLDRHLTEDDLRFASDFRNSDHGKRYRELVPRVVNESLEAGRRWGEALEPEIRARLRARGLLAY